MNPLVRFEMIRRLLVPQDKPFSLTGLATLPLVSMYSTSLGADYSDCWAKGFMRYSMELRKAKSLSEGLKLVLDVSSLTARIELEEGGFFTILLSTHSTGAYIRFVSKKPSHLMVSPQFKNKLLGILFLCDNGRDMLNQFYDGEDYLPEVKRALSEFAADMSMMQMEIPADNQEEYRLRESDIVFSPGMSVSGGAIEGQYLEHVSVNENDDIPGFESSRPAQSVAFEGELAQHVTETESDNERSRYDIVGEELDNLSTRQEDEPVVDQAVIVNNSAISSSALGGAI